MVEPGQDDGLRIRFQLREVARVLGFKLPIPGRAHLPRGARRPIGGLTDLAIHNKASTDRRPLLRGIRLPLRPPGTNGSIRAH